MSRCRKGHKFAKNVYEFVLLTNELFIQNRPIPAPHRGLIKQVLGRAVSPQQGGLVTPEVGVTTIVARVPADLELIKRDLNKVFELRKREMRYLCNQTNGLESNPVHTSAWGVRLLSVVQYPESHHVPKLLGFVL